MAGLRTMMLTIPASTVGVEPSETHPKIFGIVMDVPISGGHTASVIALPDGNASLYTTSTFGILGGIDHESVRTASKEFVKLGQSYFDGADATTDFPFPKSGHVRFYLRGFEGVRVIDAEIDSIQSVADKHQALWVAGQQVLTELRLVVQKGEVRDLRRT